MNVQKLQFMFSIEKVDTMLIKEVSENWEQSSRLSFAFDPFMKIRLFNNIISCYGIDYKIYTISICKN